MSELLQRVAEQVQDNMDAILANFKPGAKITVLVRTPDKPTADFCMTSDDFDEIVAMVQRRKGVTSAHQRNMTSWEGYQAIPALQPGQVDIITDESGHGVGAGVVYDISPPSAEEPS